MSEVQFAVLPSCDASQSVRTLRAACLECGQDFGVNPRHAREHRFCSARCRASFHRQPRLDFTPAASELAHAVRGRESKAERILARLRQGPATSIELAKITHRFSARTFDLRKKGHRISREDHVQDGQEWSVYSLEG